MSKWTYTETIPERLYVACSGGVDSVAAAAILSEWRDVTLLHFSHTDHAHTHELETVVKLSNKLGIKLITTYQTQHQLPGNREAQWRDARYRWFDSLDMPVVTAHTLDDAVEWYMMTCLRGRGEFMPHRRGQVFRPFLLTDKEKLMEYAVKRSLPWWEDPGNHDPEFSLRSRVRKELVPVAERCEPGLRGMVRRRLVEKIAEARQQVDKQQEA